MSLAVGCHHKASSTVPRPEKRQSARARRRDGAGWHCRTARQAGDRAGRAPRVEVLAVEALSLIHI